MAHRARTANRTENFEAGIQNVAIFIPIDSLCRDTQFWGDFPPALVSTTDIYARRQRASCSNADRLADFDVEADESTFAWLELFVDFPSQDR